MTTNNNLDRLGARIYGHDDATEADTPRQAGVWSQ